MALLKIIEKLTRRLERSFPTKKKKKKKNTEWGQKQKYRKRKIRKINFIRLGTLLPTSRFTCKSMKKQK